MIKSYNHCTSMKYGYFYLFLASLCLALLALIYTLFFVPETLTDLKHKNLLQRLRDCSIRKCFNCFKYCIFKNPIKAVSLFV